MDAVIEVNGEELLLEQKTWSPSYLREGLRRSLKFVETASNNRADVGQLLKDIVDFRNNNNTFRIRWDFSAEILEEYSKEQIADLIIDLVKKDTDINNNLHKVLGSPSTKQFNDFLDEL